MFGWNWLFQVTFPMMLQNLLRQRCRCTWFELWLLAVACARKPRARVVWHALRGKYLACCQRSSRTLPTDMHILAAIVSNRLRCQPRDRCCCAVERCRSRPFLYQTNMRFERQSHRGWEEPQNNLGRHCGSRTFLQCTGSSYSETRTLLQDIFRDQHSCTGTWGHPASMLGIDSNAINIVIKAGFRTWSQLEQVCFLGLVHLLLHISSNLFFFSSVSFW